MIEVASHAAGSQLPFGLAALARRAFAGADLQPIRRGLADRLQANPEDAASLLDLSVLLQLLGDRAQGLALQAAALQRQPLFRSPTHRGAAPALRLLAFLAPGDFMANTPLEFLLEDSDVALTLLYVGPGVPQPTRIPPHDLAIVAATESDENRVVLRELERLVLGWPRPVLNSPARIAPMARDTLGRLLQAIPGLVLPTTARVGRPALIAACQGSPSIRSLGIGATFPVIVRPVESHAGHGLAKIETAADLAAYLERQGDREFFLAPFIDYQGRDGLFRKVRVALIDGQPFACHLAISQHWMIHYLKAGMTESPAKRAEEANFFAGFDTDFAAHHRGTLHAIHRRVGLDYFALDCGEMPDGRLLLFEADNAMIIHAMDPPDLFPYKRQQMQKVFRAFRDMLGAASRRAAPARIGSLHRADMAINAGHVLQEGRA